jgi:hypothetical protein
MGSPAKAWPTRCGELGVVIDPFMSWKICVGFCGVLQLLLHGFTSQGMANMLW